MKKTFWSYMRDFGVATIVLLAITLMYASDATAETVTVEWSWPTQYCNSEPLPVTDLQQAEIYISEATIPRVATACDAADVDVPPAGAIIAAVPTSDTTIDIDLTCGKTYFFVMRIQVASGVWSNFSGETTRDLDCGRPNIPIIVRLT